MINFFKYKNTEIKKTYSNLLKKYTSISYAQESIDEGIKKQLSGKFLDELDCAMFSPAKGVYAIRFNDNMSPDEFETVFNLLKTVFGEPTSFCEYEGYIWKRDGCNITLGLIPLNYKYEVPMICVRGMIAPLFSIVSYEKYQAVSNAINKPLNDRGIYPQRDHYFPAFHTSEFGVFVIVGVSAGMLNVNYKKGKLQIAFSGLKPHGEYKMINPENSYKRQLLAVSVAEIEEKLDSLLDETKEYHGLEKQTK